MRMSKELYNDFPELDEPGNHEANVETSEPADSLGESENDCDTGPVETKLKQPAPFTNYGIHVLLNFLHKYFIMHVREAPVLLWVCLHRNPGSKEFMEINMSLFLSCLCRILKQL